MSGRKALGRSGRNRTAAWALVLGLTVSISAWSQPPGGGCLRETLLRRPGWTNSATWTADGSQLLVVDALYDKILRYSNLGKSLGAVPAATTAALRNFLPSAIKATGKGLLVELASGRLVALDSAFAPGPIRSVLHQGQPSEQQVLSMFQWDVAGDDLITVSDVSGDPAYLAFLRVPLAQPASFSVLDPVPVDQSGVAFRLGYPYVAGIGDTAFVLIPGSGLFRNEKGSTQLVPMNVQLPELTAPLHLPVFNEFSALPAVMDAVERSTMAAGLYVWNGELYVLTRRPDPPGTLWRLTQIDPQDGTVLGSAVVPTPANHLTVVPGPKKWAFFEKGPVEEVGRQMVPRLLLVPAAKFQRPLREQLCR